MTASRSAPVQVPRLLFVISRAVVVACVAMTFIGAWRTGVAWDETYHVERMQDFLDHGWFLLANQLDGDAPGSWERQEYVYGPAAMTLLHGWGLLWGTDSAGSVSASSDAYAVRHLGVALISLIGLAAAAALGRLALGSRRWAWVTAAILVAIPMWSGHAMFNIKDVPVASGFTLATLGLVLIGGEYAGSGRRRLLGPLALGLGITLAVGTRPGIWPGLAACAAALVVLVTLSERGSSLAETWRAVRRRYAEVLGGVLLGVVGLVATYPSAYSDPWALLTGSVESSSHYNDESSGWWYVPLVSLSEFPWLILGLAIVGTVALVRRVLAERLRPDPATIALTIVAVQAFTLPALAMVREAHLYNGLRQLLFMAPAMAVLAAFGLSVLLAREWSGPRMRSLVPVAAGVALVVPVVDQALLFPYNYAYAAPGADFTVDALPVDDEMLDEYSLDGLPTDYWRASVRALAPKIPQGGFVVCSPLMSDDGITLAYSHEGREDCSTDPIGPLAPYNDLRTGSWDDSPTEFLAVLTGGRMPGSNCEELARVTRWRHFQERVMSLVARCELRPDALPSQPMEFGPGGDGDQGQFGGWTEHPLRPGIGIVTPEARLAWTLPDDLVDRPLQIDFDVSVLHSAKTGEAVTELGPTIMVNGVDLTLHGVPDLGFYSVRVPREIAAGYGDGRLVLTFERDDFRLVSMNIEAAR